MKRAIEMKGIMAAQISMRIVGKDEMAAKRAEFSKAAKVLNDELDEVQKRCTARIITAEQICSILQSYTNDLRIPKGAMEGIEIEVNPCAQSFPRAYKFTPESTQFTAVYKRGSWRITDIRRDTCRTWKIHAKLTDAAKEAIVTRFEREWY